MSPPSSLPNELRISVTGHRDSPYPGGVAEAVDRLLEGIKQTLESACEFPRGECGSQKKHVHKILDLLVRGVGFWPLSRLPRMENRWDLCRNRFAFKPAIWAVPAAFCRSLMLIGYHPE